MRKLEFFFEKKFLIDNYKISVKGEKNLEVEIFRNDCPRLIFHGELRLLNPQNPDNREFYSLEAELLCRKEGDNLVFFIASKRDETPVLRVPFIITDSVIDATSSFLKQVPEEFLHSLKFDLRNGNFHLKIAHICIRGDHVGDVGYSTLKMSKALSSWMFFANIGVRPSKEEESLLIIEAKKQIIDAVSKQRAIWEHELNRKKTRESHVPSKEDIPVYLFCDYVDDFRYSCALTLQGEFLCYCCGTTLGDLNEEEKEKRKKEEIEEMIKKIKWDHWQYRIIIAEKHDHRIISLMEEFLKKPIKDKEGDSHLYKIFCQWTGKSMEPGWGPGWKIIAH